LWLYLRERTDLLRRNVRVLAVAPDEYLERQGPRQGWDYLSIDIAAGKAKRQMDLTALELPSADRDLVIAFHVLEHIVEDRAAMNEIARVMHPDGIAILAVPLGAEMTDERFRDAPAAIRAGAYGQPDHVRLYGRRDFADRLRRSGMDVRELHVGEEFRNSVERFGLQAEEILFIAQRRDGQAPQEGRERQ
jgi:SAM-dependent methyltransferase